MNGERPLRVQKARMFSQKEVEQLSEFTRDRLRILDSNGLLVPYKHPAILYDWKQLIFLRVLYHLREHWTLPQIESVLDKSEERILDVIKNVDKLLFLAFGTLKADNSLDLAFSLLPTYENELELMKLKKAFLTNNDYVEHFFKYLMNQESVDAQVKFGNIICYNMPILIKDLKERAIELKIKDLDLKVS